MIDKVRLATLIADLDRLVREAAPADRGVEPCLDLSDKLIENWDDLIKPILRGAL